MLSPFFPSWLIPAISPAFSIVGKSIPSAWKGTALLVLCLAVTAGVVAITPLGPDALAEQAIILFGIATAGYTVAKPAAALGKKTVSGAVVTLAVLGSAGAVLAQDASPIQASASLLAQLALGLLNGLLGRLVKRVR